MTRLKYAVIGTGAIYSAPLAEARSKGFDMLKVKMLEQQLLFIQDSYSEPSRFVDDKAYI
jgi:hypothetical protein